MIKPCGFGSMNRLMKSWTLAMKMDLNLFLPLDVEDFQALKALQTHLHISPNLDKVILPYMVDHTIK